MNPSETGFSGLMGVRFRRLQHFRHFLVRGGHRREERRGRATPGIVGEDRRKGAGRRLHRIAPERPMAVDIDKTGSQIVAAAVDHFISLGKAFLSTSKNPPNEPILHQKRSL